MAKSSPPRTARNSLMDLLSRRDYSEKEIRQKIQGKFPAEEVDTAIDFAKQRHWLPNSEQTLADLAEKAAQSLHKKGKGIHYINHFLQEKGLPEVAVTPEQELEKALTLVKNRFSALKFADPSEKEKMGRFLVSRGFDLSIVRKVIYEKL